MGLGVHFNLANIPAPDLDNWATQCIEWPSALNMVILPILQELSWPDLWDGTPEQQSTMTAVIQTLIVKLITGEPCESGSDNGGDDGAGADDYIADTTYQDYIAALANCGDQCSIDEGASDMGCCMRWNNGVLEIFTCGAWEPVPGLQSGNSGDGDSLPDGWSDDIPTDTETPWDYDACGKAYAMVELIFSVGNAVWEQADNLDAWDWVGSVESDTGVNLNNALIIEAITEAKGMLALNLEPTGVFNYTPSYMFSDSMKSRMRQVLLPFVGGDNDHPMLTSAIPAFVSAWIGSLAPDAILGGFWSSCMRAIHPNRWANTTAAGALDTSRDCGATLPESQPTIPDSNGWYLSANLDTLEFLTDGGSWDVQGMRGLAAHDVYGVAFKVEWTASPSTVKRMDWSNTEGPGESLSPVDVSLSPNTSDALNGTAGATAGLSAWFIQSDDSDVNDSLMARLGVSTFYTVGGGVDDTTTPAAGASKGDVVGFRLDTQDEPQVVELAEVRLIYKAGDGS